MVHRILTPATGTIREPAAALLPVPLVPEVTTSGENLGDPIRDTIPIKDRTIRTTVKDRAGLAAGTRRTNVEPTESTKRRRVRSTEEEASRTMADVVSRVAVKEATMDAAARRFKETTAVGTARRVTEVETDRSREDIRATGSIRARTIAARKIIRAVTRPFPYQVQPHRETAPAADAACRSASPRKDLAYVYLMATTYVVHCCLRIPGFSDFYILLHVFVRSRTFDRRLSRCAGRHHVRHTERYSEVIREVPGIQTCVDTAAYFKCLRCLR